MIWTIVMWLGMQGQGHVPLSQCGIQANSDVIIDCSGATPEQAQEWKGRPCIGLELGCAPQVWQTPLEPSPGILMPPAEHVFEIRTKRVEREIRWHDCKPVGNGNFCMNITKDQRCSVDEINMGVSSAFVGGYVEKCVRITRELYMDGKRLGIIKGLE